MECFSNNWIIGSLIIVGLYILYSTTFVYEFYKRERLKKIEELDRRQTEEERKRVEKIVEQYLSPKNTYHTYEFQDAVVRVIEKQKARSAEEVNK